MIKCLDLVFKLLNYFSLFFFNIVLKLNSDNRIIILYVYVKNLFKIMNYIRFRERKKVKFINYVL